jgi:DSBA-like thioredoxin domain
VAHDIYILAFALTGITRARLYQLAADMLCIAMFAIAVAAFANWRNTELGNWLNICVVDWTDGVWVLVVVSPDTFLCREGSCLRPCLSLVAETAVVVPVEQQRLILKDPGTAILGSENPDVTVVEYFDYNCPFCRKLAPSIHRLVDKDHKVAVVFKEWPIFGGISVYAA